MIDGVFYRNGGNIRQMFDGFQLIRIERYRFAECRQTDDPDQLVANFQRRLHDQGDFPMQRGIQALGPMGIILDDDHFMGADDFRKNPAIQFGGKIMVAAVAALTNLKSAIMAVLFEQIHKTVSNSCQDDGFVQNSAQNRVQIKLAQQGGRGGRQSLQQFVLSGQFVLDFVPFQNSRGQIGILPENLNGFAAQVTRRVQPVGRQDSDQAITMLQWEGE